MCSVMVWIAGWRPRCAQPFLFQLEWRKTL
jgi:hypothetical protein